MRCPDCGTKNSIVITPGIVCRPLGTFSLAGTQMKVSAHTVAIADCTVCDLHVLGHLEDPELAEDGKTFTGGRFVTEPPD